jgi:hypothetical protein
MNGQPASQYLPGLHLIPAELKHLALNPKFGHIFRAELCRRNGRIEIHLPPGLENLTPTELDGLAANPKFRKIFHMEPAPNGASDGVRVRLTRAANATPVAEEQLDRYRRTLTAEEQRAFDEYLNGNQAEIKAADAEKRQLNLLAAVRAALHPKGESGTGLTGGGKQQKLAPVGSHIRYDSDGWHVESKVPDLPELARQKKVSLTRSPGGMLKRPKIDRGTPLNLGGLKGRIAELWQGGLSTKYIVWIMNEENPGMDFTLSEIGDMVRGIRKIAMRKAKKETNSDNPSCDD